MEYSEEERMFALKCVNSILVLLESEIDNEKIPYMLITIGSSLLATTIKNSVKEEYYGKAIEAITKHIKDSLFIEDLNISVDDSKKNFLFEIISRLKDSGL